jgi:hypothetical protein
MNRPKINDVIFNDPERYTDMAKYSEGLDKYIDYLESKTTKGQKLPLDSVRNFVSQEIERRRDLILSEPDGIVREQMINNLALDL